jgi:hypothetical protein
MPKNYPSTTRPKWGVLTAFYRRERDKILPPPEAYKRAAHFFMTIQSGRSISAPVFGGGSAFPLLGLGCVGASGMNGWRSGTGFAAQRRGVSGPLSRVFGVFITEWK